MKKLLGIIVLSLLVSASAYADLHGIKKLTESHYKKLFIDGDEDSYWIDRFCIDGYVFVQSNIIRGRSYQGTRAASTSITQFFEVVDGKSLPKRCS